MKLMNDIMNIYVFYICTFRFVIGCESYKNLCVYQLIDKRRFHLNSNEHFEYMINFFLGEGLFWVIR